MYLSRLVLKAVITSTTTSTTREKGDIYAILWRLEISFIPQVVVLVVAAAAAHVAIRQTAPRDRQTERQTDRQTE